MGTGTDPLHQGPGADPHRLRRFEVIETFGELVRLDGGRTVRFRPHTKDGASLGPASVADALRSLRGPGVQALRTEKQDGRPALQVVLEADPGIDPAALLATIAARDDVTDLRTTFEREVVE